MTYQNIIVETRDRTGVIRLNRPQRMNALNDALAVELKDALERFDADDQVSAIVITGNDKAFAAGAAHAKKETDEYAVMIDARFPLTVAPLPEGVENRAYVDSWKSRPA